jgi:hypothetical protein
MDFGVQEGFDLGKRQVAVLFGELAQGGRTKADKNFFVRMFFLEKPG